MNRHQSSRPIKQIESSMERSSHAGLANAIRSEAGVEALLESAFERSEELLKSTIQTALSDSGVYAGIVLWEGKELLLQRISSATAVLHDKGMLSEIPSVGQSVRIAYSNGVGTVKEIVRENTLEIARERNSRELDR
jgi:hypothetical protein